jgi:ATP-dependent RNA/DNA helicase IGHMBP2
MSRIIEELKHTLSLLKIEWKEDLEYYKRKVLLASIQDKKKDGVCWYPVVIKKSYISTGEQLVVEVERISEKDTPHVFQSGKIVSFYSNTSEKDNRHNHVSGVIKFHKGNLMAITLNANDLPDWIDDGKLGVDLLFDEASYKEMEFAMKKVINLEGGRTFELREILLGSKDATFHEGERIEAPNLNKSQNDALNQVLAAEDVAIIHGPPGTGKTTTLVQCIKHTLKREKKVLVCAPSNAAVDLLTEKLGEQGLKVIRLGHPARITEAVLSRTLDAQIANHDSYKDLRMVRKKSEEFKSIGLKYKRNFGHAERQQRKMLLGEARSLKEEADALEYYIINDLFEKAQVFACTLVGASQQMLRDMNFRTVFIDEAAQALEPASWIPILKAQRVIFAGDHFQLPPTIKSFEAGKQGLSVTLFEKAIDRNNADVMLKTQYRMNEAIMNFSSRKFYQNGLIAHPSVANGILTEDEPPMEFIDTAGCGFNEQIDKETLSSFNKEEVNLLFTHFTGLINKITPKKIIEEKIKIGIISPYKAQVGQLNEAYDEREEYKSFAHLVSIDTIDAFQGQERDIIYISLVRSNDSGEIGFLGDIRRMNVAMTRAKRKLVMIGDSATLASNKFYSDLLDYVTEINAYKSAYEILY